jgi:hypothetical protein
MNLLNGTEMLEVNFYLLVFIPSERSSVSDNRNELLKLELQGSILQNSIPAETVRIKFWKKITPKCIRHTFICKLWTINLGFMVL